MLKDEWPDFEFVIANPPYSLAICVILLAIEQWLKGQNVVLIIPAFSWTNSSSNAIWSKYPGIAHTFFEGKVAFESEKKDIEVNVCIVGFL